VANEAPLTVPPETTSTVMLVLEIVPVRT